MSLTWTRSHDAAFTYEQMRNIARASLHDNTVAVPAMAYRAPADSWPGEAWEHHDWTVFDCGHDGPSVDARGRTDGSLVCPNCWFTERRP